MAGFWRPRGQLPPLPPRYATVGKSYTVRYPGQGSREVMHSQVSWSGFSGSHAQSGILVRVLEESCPVRYPGQSPWKVMHSQVSWSGFSGSHAQSSILVRVLEKSCTVRYPGQSPWKVMHSQVSWSGFSGSHAQSSILVRVIEKSCTVRHPGQSPWKVMHSQGPRRVMHALMCQARPKDGRSATNYVTNLQVLLQAGAPK